MMSSNPWALAIRPKTLPASVAPIILGSAMAFGDGVFHFPSACLCLLIALCLQIATNLTNDYFDAKQGADTNRVGPVRVTQSGLVKPQIVLAAGLAVFLLSILLSIPLIMRAGFIIVILALVSVASGFFYTAGKKSLGYVGLGEIFVFIFFGPVAVAGTYFVQGLTINPAVIVAGFAPGFISSAILVVNNLRDMDGDRRVGKNTLAVRFGRSFVLGEYLFLMMAAILTPLAVLIINPNHPGIVLAALTGFIAIPTIRRVMTSNEALVLNEALAQTGRLLLMYTILFSAGWLWGH